MYTYFDKYVEICDENKNGGGDVFYTNKIIFNLTIMKLFSLKEQENYSY